MPTLWELLKTEDERAKLRGYMPRNWRPDDGNPVLSLTQGDSRPMVKIDAVLEDLEEIEKIVRQAPKGR